MSAPRDRIAARAAAALLAATLVAATPALMGASANLDSARGVSRSTSEQDRQITNDETLRNALANAKPGDRLRVAPGEYKGFSADHLRGTEAQPIVITAADPASPPRFTGGVHLSDAAHLVLEHLTIVGAAANGLNIDDGGTVETPSHHLVLRNLTVRDCGGRANHDGIKLSGVVEFVLEKCVVERWGRGGSAVDMVGCQRGRLEECTFRDREEESASTGVQTKGGSSAIVIRRCRFEHAGQRAVNIGGSTGLAYFRPAVPKANAFEARDITVEGCTFVGSTAPIAYVGVDGATVRFNTFHLPRKWVLRILQETREPAFVPCRNGLFTDNLVVYRATEVATAVNVGPGTAPETFTFARNYWHALDAPARSAPALPVLETSPAIGPEPRFVDAPTDLRQRPDSPARAHGADALPRTPSLAG